MDLSDWIVRRADSMPDKPAIRFEGADITYSTFSEKVSRLTGLLRGLGLKRGEAVSFLGFSNPEMLAMLFACARLGAMLMPLNWRLAAPEHRAMLNDCTPFVLLAEAKFVEQLDSIRGSLGDVRLIALGGERQGWLSYGTLLESAPRDASRDPKVNYDSPALLCYTSGSAGAPKGVVLTQGALFWNAVNSAHLHDMTSADRILTTIPLFHVGGLNNQTLPALHAGATVVLHPRFDVDAVFDAIEKERATLTVLVPAQLDMMLAHPRWHSADLSSLRMITTGSTIIPDRVTRAVHARGIPLAQIYGSTETCPIATYTTARDARSKPGSAGKPAVHCECRLVDDNDMDVPRGATGEILVRGPNVMAGYWKKPEATAAALKDGWFHTGDMGHYDEDGYLFVDGRKKDMIISGGENIYPAEIENVLAECGDIAEASVVGRADERWGEIVVAVVVVKSGSRMSEKEVLELFEGRIARYKHPKRVIFSDSLPRTALGKVKKEDVRRMAQEAATAQRQPDGAGTWR